MILTNFYKIEVRILKKMSNHVKVPSSIPINNQRNFFKTLRFLVQLPQKNIENFHCKIMKNSMFKSQKKPRKFADSSLIPGSNPTKISLKNHENFQVQIPQKIDSNFQQTKHQNFPPSSLFTIPKFSFSPPGISTNFHTTSFHLSHMTRLNFSSTPLCHAPNSFPQPN